MKLKEADREKQSLTQLNRSGSSQFSARIRSDQDLRSGRLLLLIMKHSENFL